MRLHHFWSPLENNFWPTPGKSAIAPWRKIIPTSMNTCVAEM